MAAHAALTGELLLFLLQLQPHVEAGRLAADHVALVAALERDGAGVLRAHLRESAETLGAKRPVNHDRADGVRPPARLMRRGVAVPRGRALTTGLPRHAVSETQRGQSRNETRCIRPGSSSA